MANNQTNQNQGNQSQPQQRSGRGFAGMDPDRQREIASQGGRSVAAESRSFSRDHKLAADAGRKGGENSHGNRAGNEARTAPSRNEQNGSEQSSFGSSYEPNGRNR